MRSVIQPVVVFSIIAAVAFDQADWQAARAAEASLAGHQASLVTVEPRPTPELPEGTTGIAAKYPGDVGIENDPDVVFVETFEGSVDEICSRWESVGGKPILSTRTKSYPAAAGGSRCC
jgi:hypothetical protein